MIIDISFHSDTSDKSPEKTESNMICTEIQQGLFNGWSNHYVDENDDNEGERSQQNEDFNQQNNFSESIDNQEKDKEQNENDKQLSSLGKESVLSQPKTITLFQDTLVSRQTGSQISKISQLTASIQNQSYSSFLHMKQTVYDIHQRNYEQLFDIINQFFSQRINFFQDTYVTFLKTKIQQQKLYADMCLDRNKNESNRQKQITQSVYINCKSLTSEIKRKSNLQCQKSRKFVEKVIQLYEQTWRMFQEVKILFNTRVQIIKNVLQMIKNIGQEIEAIIISNQKSKCIKFFGNTYVISKYLTQRQKIYLQILKKYTKEIINFVNTICRQIQPKISISLKDMLMSYADIESQFREHKNAKTEENQKALTNLNCCQAVYEQIIGILTKIIPKNLIKSALIVKQGTNDEYLECIIEKLNMDVQTFIFLPSIEADTSNITYSSVDKVKVFWKKEKEETKEINLYLSNEGHIIFQIKRQDGRVDDFIATLRINGIKFSKKDNKILLTDKTKGMLDYLLSDAVPLGELVFEPLNLMKKKSSTEEKSKTSEYIDEFIKGVKVLSKQKKGR